MQGGLLRLLEQFFFIFFKHGQPLLRRINSFNFSFIHWGIYRDFYFWMLQHLFVILQQKQSNSAEQVKNKQRWKNKL